MAFTKSSLTGKTAKTGNYKTAFVLMSMLFFIWGAIVSLNDVLIPHLKSLFQLFMSQGIQF